MELDILYLTFWKVKSNLLEFISLFVGSNL